MKEWSSDWIYPQVGVSFLTVVLECIEGTATTEAPAFADTRTNPELVTTPVCLFSLSQILVGVPQVHNCREREKYYYEKALEGIPFISGL